jgi:hypothetical protein
MRNQYLHLSAYLCDLCAEPVIAGSLGVRESEISKESGDQFSGSDLRAVRSTARIPASSLGRVRYSFPIEWEVASIKGAGHLEAAYVEALNRAELR